MLSMIKDFTFVSSNAKITLLSLVIYKSVHVNHLIDIWTLMFQVYTLKWDKLITPIDPVFSEFFSDSHNSGVV